MTKDLPAMKEVDYQGRIIETARILGWTVAHFRAAMTKYGWRTPVAADGQGFPDLVLVRERVIWMEVKLEKAKLTPEQAHWQEILKYAKQETYVVRPSNWDEVVKILQR